MCPGRLKVEKGAREGGKTKWGRNVHVVIVPTIENLKIIKIHSHASSDG